MTTSNHESRSPWPLGPSISSSLGNVAKTYFPFLVFPDQWSLEYLAENLSQFLQVLVCTSKWCLRSRPAPIGSPNYIFINIVPRMHSPTCFSTKTDGGCERAIYFLECNLQLHEVWSLTSTSPIVQEASPPRFPMFNLDLHDGWLSSIYVRRITSRVHEI
jgi:hypothetical protein